MNRRHPTLVVSGLPLANPHVGQGVYTLRLIEGLTRQIGREFVVVAPPSVTRPPEIPAHNFVTMPPFRAPRQPVIHHALASDHMLRFVAREFVDAVFHSPGPIVGLTIPAHTIVTLHDCIYRHFSNYHGRFFLRRLLMQGTERFAARAALILTDSEFSKRDLIANAKLPETKIDILYPWVGNEFSLPISPAAVQALRDQLKLPERFWLYLGGYDHRKNIEFLLDAYAAAARSRELPPLVLAGKIPVEKHRAHCDVAGALKRTGLTTEQVILPGQIAARDLPALYRAAALFIYPSLMEGFGLPPAEATAVGTPVLSSNASSLPEVVLNRDCLFDPRNRDALVDKLLAGAKNERHFTTILSPTFTEPYGIKRYLQFIDAAAAQANGTD